MCTSSYIFMIKLSLTMEFDPTRLSKKHVKKARGCGNKNASELLKTGSVIWYAYYVYLLAWWR